MEHCEVCGHLLTDPNSYYVTESDATHCRPLVCCRGGCQFQCKYCGKNTRVFDQVVKVRGVEKTRVGRTLKCHLTSFIMCRDCLRSHPHTEIDMYPVFCEVCGTELPDPANRMKLPACADCFMWWVDHQTPKDAYCCYNIVCRRDCHFTCTWCHQPVSKSNVIRFLQEKGDRMIDRLSCRDCAQRHGCDPIPLYPWKGGTSLREFVERYIDPNTDQEVDQYVELFESLMTKM
jgi:hypothetical protein